MKQITLDIKEIKIMKMAREPDRIFLETTLPDSCWPYTEDLTIRIDAANGSGLSYVKRNFGFDRNDCTVIDANPTQINQNFKYSSKVNYCFSGNFP